MYVGLDVAKNKSNVCILDKGLKVVKEFEIKHNKAGFEELEKHINPYMKIGLETTGNYCRTIYKYLKKKYDVGYVDNVQMKNFARLNSPTIKNDKVDARLIAKFLHQGYKRINPIKVDELKDLTKLHYKLVTQLGRFKIMFKEQTNIIFPELEDYSSLSQARGIQDLLLKYPSPKLIKKATVEELQGAITKNLKFCAIYNLQFVKKIKNLANNSIGVEDFPTTCYEYTLKILKFYQKLVDEIKDRMLIKLLETPYYRLLDIKGYNYLGLAKIVGEIGDIRRFPNHRKFVSYCGLDITEKQSGSVRSQNCRITKKGSRILRFTFYVQALQNIAGKRNLYPFYKRLKERGKASRQAITACARKLAVWTYYEMKKCHN